MRRYLDEETGDLPDAIPERVLSLAIFFGAIVAWVTDHLPDADEYTNVPCRRSPGRRRCRGEIIAHLDRTSGYIEWHCPLCGDNGLIHGWEDTPWDRQHARRADDPFADDRALTHRAYYVRRLGEPQRRYARIGHSFELSPPGSGLRHGR